MTRENFKRKSSINVAYTKYFLLTLSLSNSMTKTNSHLRVRKQENRHYKLEDRNKANQINTNNNSTKIFNKIET